MATAVIGGVSAYQQYKGGKAQQAAYEEQAGIDRMGAADARAQGDREDERLLWRTRQALGQQRAAIGASGLDPAFGTPTEILGETAQFGEIERQDARLNAARQAWGYEASAIGNQNQGANAAWSGRQAAIGTALGSLIQAGSMYYGNRPATGGGKYTVQRETIPVQRFRYS